MHKKKRHLPTWVLRNWGLSHQFKVFFVLLRSVINQKFGNTKPQLLKAPGVVCYFTLKNRKKENMTENIRLKTLISISLLIFILPFIQTCSDKSLKNLPVYKLKFTGFVEDSINRKIEYNKETKINDTLRKFIEVTKIEKQKIIAKNRIEKEVWRKKTKKEYTYNLYFLGFGNYKEFEIRFFTDKTFYIMLNFTLIVIFTFIMLIISFKNRFKQIILLSSLNLVFLFVATFSLYLFNQIEEIKQIKYGFYLFVINSILIIIESRNRYIKNINR